MLAPRAPARPFASDSTCGALKRPTIARDASSCTRLTVQTAHCLDQGTHGDGPTAHCDEIACRSESIEFVVAIPAMPVYSAGMFLREVSRSRRARVLPKFKCILVREYGLPSMLANVCRPELLSVARDPAARGSAAARAPRCADRCGKDLEIEEGRGPTPPTLSFGN